MNRTEINGHNFVEYLHVRLHEFFILHPKLLDKTFKDILFIASLYDGCNNKFPNYQK